MYSSSFKYIKSNLQNDYGTFTVKEPRIQFVIVMYTCEVIKNLKSTV